MYLLALHVYLHKKVSVKFRKSSGSGVRILAPYTDSGPGKSHRESSTGSSDECRVERLRKPSHQANRLERWVCLYSCWRLHPSSPFRVVLGTVQAITTYSHKLSRLYSRSFINRCLFSYIYCFMCFIPCLFVFFLVVNWLCLPF